MPDVKVFLIMVAPIVGAIFTYIGFKRGFFRNIYHYEPAHLPKFLHVLLGFFAFFGIQVVVAVIMLRLWESGGLFAQVWILWLATIISSLLVFFCSLPKKIRSIWGKINFAAVKTAFWSFFIIVPWVLFISHLGTYLVENYFEAPLIEQDPVRYLKELAYFPDLFFVTGLMMVTLIPLSEEILFRGLLQGYAARYLPVSWAVIVSSLIFTAFHYSGAQGITNYALLPPLFILSCFLGFLRLKTGSLLAPITLHSLFNFINIILLILSSD